MSDDKLATVASTENADARPAPKLKTISSWYRWELMVLLFLAYFFHQADRAIFGVVATSIKEQFQLSDAALGFTRTVMFTLMALIVPFAGFVGDRCNKRRLLIACLFFWSVATLCTGSVQSALQLTLFNSVALVVAEAFYGPASTSLIASYHQKTRSVALSIHQTAVYLSVIFCGGIAGWVSQHSGDLAIKIGTTFSRCVDAVGLSALAFSDVAEWDPEKCGWRVAFWGFGLASLIVGLLLVLRLKDPAKVKFADGSAIETAKPSESGSALDSLKGFIKVYFTTPSAMLLTVGFTAIVFVNNAYLNVVSRFLQNKFGLDQAAAGWNGMFWHHIAAFACIYLGGFLSDRVAKTNASFRPKLQFVAMTLGAPIVCAIGFAPTLSSVYALFFLMGVCRGFYECNTHASVFETIPVKYRSTTVGVMILFAFLVGAWSAQIVGAFYDAHGLKGYQEGFLTLGAAWVVGAICVGIAAFKTFKRDAQKAKALNEKA